MKEQYGFFSKKNNRALLLCSIGLLINIVGVRIALGFDLPLYLDNIGSALAAALGGFIPGIVVGFLTNLINAIGDYSTAYYGSLTVLIAICSAYFASKGFYQRVSRLPLIILTFALIGGGLGSILTWALYGFDFGTGISAPLALQIFNSSPLSKFWSQFSADMLIDLLDKTITVVIVALALRLIPERIKELFVFSGWQQRPLSLKELTRNARRKGRLSLRWEIILLVSSATLLTALAVAAISYYHFKSASIDEQETFAKGIVQVVRESVDAEKVDEYLEKGESVPGYADTEFVLKSLMESSPYIEGRRDQSGHL